jgi:hypothetical protein
MLREAGVVSGEIIRQAVDAILIQYQPLITVVEETRARREQLRRLGILGARTMQGVKGKQL